MAQDEAPKKAEGLVAASDTAIAEQGAAAAAAAARADVGAQVQVTIEHAVKHDKAVLSVPDTATVREVLEVLAAALGRPEIVKNGRIVKKSTAGQAFVSMKATEKLGKKRHCFIMGVDNLDGAVVSLAQALKMHAPGKEPPWVLEQTTKMQEELNASFADPDFQRRLQELEWMLLPAEQGQFLVERQQLAFEVHKQVLPKYGFESTERGVRDMMTTTTAMTMHYQILFRNMHVGDRLLRVPMSDTLNVKKEYIQGYSEAFGVTPEALVERLNHEIEEATLATLAAAAQRAASKPAQAAATPNWQSAQSLARANSVSAAGNWSGPSLDAVKPPVCNEVLIVRTSQQGRERLSPVTPLRLAEASAVHSDEASVVVEPKTKFQSFLGFGGSFTESSAELWQALGDENQKRVMEACFRTDSGLGYRLGRVHMNSCDFSNGNWSCCEEEGDNALRSFSLDRYKKAIFPMLRRANRAVSDREHPLRLLASPWSPPGWMKDTGRMCDGGCLRKEYRAAWAAFYVRFAREMEATGLPLWGFSVQNEPMAVTGWENCLYTATEERDFVRDHLGPALWKSGLDLKLLIWDHNRSQMFDRARTIYADEEAAKYVWGTAFHWYGDPRYEKWPDEAGQVCFGSVARVHELRPDKHLLMTEACQEGGPHKGEWSLGERYAESIIKDLNNWTEGWIDWNLLLDEKGGPNHVGNYCSAPILVDVKRDFVLFQSSYYFIGHFSRYIRPGAKRILCAASRDVLEVTAFENMDGTIAVVVLNQSELSVNFSLDVAGRAAPASAPKHSISTFFLKRSA